MRERAEDFDLLFYNAQVWQMLPQEGRETSLSFGSSVFCFQFSVSICALGSAHMKDPWAGARELKASKANSREVYTSEAAAEGGKSSA